MCRAGELCPVANWIGLVKLESVRRDPDLKIRRFDPCLWGGQWTWNLTRKYQIFSQNFQKTARFYTLKSCCWRLTTPPPACLSPLKPLTYKAENKWEIMTFSLHKRGCFGWHDHYDWETAASECHELKHWQNSNLLTMISFVKGDKKIQNASFFLTFSDSQKLWIGSSRTTKKTASYPSSTSTTSGVKLWQKKQRKRYILLQYTLQKLYPVWCNECCLCTLPDLLIGVHCTHGINRTGYLICRYMINELSFKPKNAIEGQYTRTVTLKNNNPYFLALLSSCIRLKWAICDRKCQEFSIHAVLWVQQKK